MEINKDLSMSQLLEKQRIMFPLVIFFLAFLIVGKIYKSQNLVLASIKEKINEEQETAKLVDLVKIRHENFVKHKNKYALKDASLLMQEISQGAAESGVRMLSLAPLSPVMSDIFRILPFSLKVQGDYHKIGEFISRIESSADSAFKVANFNLSPSESSSKKAEVLNADITINATGLAE